MVCRKVDLKLKGQDCPISSLAETMKNTTKKTTKKGTDTTAIKAVESTGFKVLNQLIIPCNIMDYKSVKDADPIDGDGSSARELELNARRHFISKRKWQDFGVLVGAPQLKTVRTGVVDDSRYFEIVNDRGEYAQCTMINSPKNVDSGGTYGHQKMFKELTSVFIAAEETGSTLWLKTTTRNPHVWKSTQGGPEPFIWFDSVQVTVA